MANEFKIKNGLIVSGSATFEGGITAQAFTGSFSGNINSAVSASYAATASYALNAADSVWVDGAQGAISYTGGNVGIGTASPAGGRLHVVSTGDELVRLEHSSGTGNPYISFYQSGTRRSYIQFLDSENNLRLASEYGIVSFLTGDANNETERMRITSAGNVGIGTTSPSEVLHVNSSTDPTILISNGGGTSPSPRLTLYRQAGVSADIIYDVANKNLIFQNDYTTADSAGNIYFNTRGSNNRLTITGAGNVGIGTTSPLVKLDVQGAGGSAVGYTDVIAKFKRTQANENSYIAIDNTTAGYDSGIRFAEAGITKWTLLNYRSSNPDGFAFYNHTASNIPFFIGDSSNVGIGTTSPNYQLTLGGNSVGSTSGLRINDPSNAAYGAHFSFSDTPNEVWIGGITNNVYNSAIGIHREATRAVTVDVNNNVGIGTTSPVSKLHTVLSSGQGTPSNYAGNVATFQTNNSTGFAAYISIISGDTGRSGVLFGDKDAMNRGIVSYAHTNDRLEFGAAGNFASMVVDSTGNVGIGTTSPGEKLEVDGNIKIGNQDLLKLGSDYTYISSTAADDLSLVANRHTTFSSIISGVTYENLRITEAGNVGIGTTSPTAKLHVSGTSDVFLVEGSGSSSNTTIMAIDGNNGRLFEISDDLSDSLFSVNTVAGLPVMEAFADNRVILGAYNQNDLVVSGSNVGIGTDAPLSKFHVKTGNDADKDQGIVIERSINSDRGYINYQGGGFQFRATNGDPIVFGTVSNERVRILDNGNVGIGTTSPLYKLDVSSGNSSNAFGLSLSGTERLKIYADSSNNFFEAKSGQSFKFTTTGGASFNILNGGNVGIGTTSPDVYSFGGGRILTVSSTSTYSVLVLASGNANSGGISMGNQTIRRAAIDHLDGSHLVFYTNGTNSGTTVSERMRITSAGNVGVGTTSPLGKLHVENSSVRSTVNGGADNIVIEENGYSGITILSSNANAGQIHFGDQNAENIGMIQYFHSDDSMRFTANAAERMRITSAGNVGIGTTSPIGALEVQAASTINGTQLTIANGYGESSKVISFNHDSDAIAQINTYGRHSTTGAGPSFSIDVSNGTSAVERLRITKDGNVGIGTTSPTEKLDINGNLKVSGIITAQEFHTEFVSASILYESGSTKFGDTSDDIHSFTGSIQQSGSDSHFLGNVGIGTTSPSAKLDVIGGGIHTNGSIHIETGAPNLILQDSTDDDDHNITFKNNAGTDFYSIDTSGDTFNIRSYYARPVTILTNNSERLRVDGSGNVGIGETNPTTKLYIKNTSGDADITLQGSSQTMRIDQNSIRTTTASQIHIFTNNTGTNGIYISSTGNVGIGTTSPAFKLDVNGNTRIGGNSGSNTARLNVGGVANEWVADFQASSTTNQSYGLVVRAGTSSTDFPFYVLNSSSANAFFAIKGNGNVGIGTTSPSYKLDVAGNSRFVSGNESLTVFQVNGWATNYLNSSLSAGAVAHIFGKANSLNNSATLRYYHAADASTSNYIGLGFYGNDDLLRLFVDAGVRLTGYGSGTKTGTPAYNLAVTSTGNIIELPGGVVDGSGTANYVTKWIDANTVGNSQIFDNGTNVGIGTTSPDTNLEVEVSSAGGGPHPYSRFHVKGDTYAAMSIGSPNNGYGWYMFGDTDDAYVGGMAYDHAVDAMYFNVNNNTALYVNSSRNVGIGTTSPGEKLDVVGNIKAQYDGNNYSRVGQNSSGGYLQAYSGAVEKIMLRSYGDSFINGGNVGIGTTSPSTKFYVDGGESTFNRGNSDGAIARFRGKNAEKAVIGTVDSWFASNVGIGTTSPSYKLHVYGGADQLKLQSTGTDSRINIGHSTNGGYIGYTNLGATSNVFYVTTGAGTIGSGIVMDNNGNVGIGTTTPSSILHIYTATGRSFQVDQSTANITVLKNDYGLELRSGGGYDLQLNALGSSTFGSVTLRTNGSEVMRAASNGNVGIGTTSPSTKLHVVGDLTVTGASNISTLENSGTITTADWNTLFTSPKLRVISAHGMTAGANNAPPLSYTYGAALTYNRTSSEGFQLYFPENAADSTSGDRRIAYRTGWNGTWSSWRRFVDMIDNVGYVTGGNNTGFEIHSDVGYNQNPGTYLLLRGQADNNQPYALKVLVTGNASGNDIEWRRLKFNGADERMYYAPEGANQIIFDYTFVQGSDERKKDNITLISDPIQKIKQLRGAEFDWNQGVHEGTHDVGVIAQDVEAVLPEAVTTQQDGYKNVAYNKIIPLLIEGMKEQQAMIEQLTARIQALENK